MIKKNIRIYDFFVVVKKERKLLFSAIFTMDAIEMFIKCQEDKNKHERPTRKTVPQRQRPEETIERNRKSHGGRGEKMKVELRGQRGEKRDKNVDGRALGVLETGSFFFLF